MCGKGVDFGGRGLVQKKKSPDFRSSEVGISGERGWGGGDGEEV